MSRIPDDFEAVGVAFQTLCRTVDRAVETVRDEHRNSPALPAYECILRSLCSTTLPNALQRLSELERGIRRGDKMAHVVAFAKANPDLFSK